MSENSTALQKTLSGENIGSLRISRRSGTKGQKRIIQANPIRIGKDELNLIEHPFAVLWQKEADDAVIFYEWDARHPVSGKLLPASWMVSGHRDHGLPTANDERVYLVLLELTREAGFESHTVYFSRYDILQRLGWDTGQKSYAMLQAAFDRLQGVTINAKNAFWNPKSRSFRNTAFNIIDLYDIEAEPPGRKKAAQRELPLSYFKWSDVMFDSFQSGYIRTLDLDFALALDGDIALRLYRYLDKKAYDGRGTFEIELFNLCIGHLGMKPSPYPSKLKERLKPAHDELMARGFLKAVTFEPMKTKKSVKVRYLFSRRSLNAARSAPLPEANQAEALLQIAEPSTPELQSTAPPQATRPLQPLALIGDKDDFSPNGLSPEQVELLGRMVSCKVSPDVAHDLLQSTTSELLRLQLDCLDDREPRDRAATFVQAVRQAWEPPNKYLERLGAAQKAKTAIMDREASAAQKDAQEAAERSQKAVAEQESLQLDTMWETLDERTRERIEEQAKERLGVIGRSGRAQGAFVAMRRNLLRELLSQTSD